MDNRTLTRLLVFIANGHETNKHFNTRMNPEFTKRLLLHKFPDLTAHQIENILRIL